MGGRQHLEDPAATMKKLPSAQAGPGHRQRQKADSRRSSGSRAPTTSKAADITAMAITKRTTIGWIVPIQGRL